MQTQRCTGELAGDKQADALWPYWTADPTALCEQPGPLHQQSGVVGRRGQVNRGDVQEVRAKMERPEQNHPRTAGEHDKEPLQQLHQESV